MPAPVQIAKRESALSPEYDRLSSFPLARLER